MNFKKPENLSATFDIFYPEKPFDVIGFGLNSVDHLCIVDRPRCFAFPGLPISAKDTTGAGDVFHGGFIYGILQNWPLDRIMAFANAAAGLSCMHAGARTGIRPFSEIIRHAPLLAHPRTIGNAS